MSRAHRLLPLLCLPPLVALGACGEESTPLSADGLPGIEEPGPVPPTLNPLSARVEGYSEPGELRSGFIYDQSGRPARITYEIHEGLAIWQGDIVIGTPDQVPTSMAQLASAGGPLPGVVIDDNSKRWPGGVVPYNIDDAHTRTG